MTTTTSWLAATIEQWPTDRLLPYARNARTHSNAQIAQIAASIAEFGFTNPILAGADGVIVAGHGRLAAARKLGLSVVPVVVLDHLSPTQRRALVIADNRLAETAAWDDAMLALEFEELAELGFDLDLTGFSQDEIDALAPTGQPGLTEDDDTPDVPPDAVTQPGDLWICGDHRVLCGDSTKVADVERLTGGQLVDLWLTDPPYNVAYRGKTKDALEIENDSMDDESFRSFLRAACIAADRVMKPGAVFYLWHADSEGYNFRGACIDAGWSVRQCLIWKKQKMVLGRQDYHWKHEPCLYGWKAGAAHLWASDRTQTTVLEFDRPSRSAEHPTMKPVALFEYQLLNNSRRGDRVLDSFGGSGTTLIAAEKHARQALLLELDPRYVDVIVRRWQEFTGKAATRESDGRTFAEAAQELETA